MFLHIFWPQLKSGFWWFFTSDVAHIFLVEPLVSGCTYQDCIRMGIVEDCLPHPK